MLPDLLRVSQDAVDTDHGIARVVVYIVCDTVLLCPKGTKGHLLKTSLGGSGLVGK